MTKKLYKLECITNLHVGSGEANFSIIDNEVEKDIEGNPIIHASSIKGALRDYVRSINLENEKINEIINYMFGQPAQDNTANGRGQYTFFDAGLLYRPMRAWGNPEFASVSVTSLPLIKRFVGIIKAFDLIDTQPEELKVDFENNEFLCSETGITIEGEDTAKLDDETAKIIKSILGVETFALAADLVNYDLPSIARNCLDENNRNLWYEEFVPHGSAFYTIIMSPDDKFELDINNKIVQFGANASIGCGFVKITEMIIGGQK